MEFFNKKQLEAMKTGVYICENCGSQMEFEDQWEDSLVCLNCGNSTDVDHYGFTDEEYDALYPTYEEVMGIETVAYDEEDDWY
jgi:transcription initiation factor IIE alpha subunit